MCLFVNVLIKKDSFENCKKLFKFSPLGDICQ